MKSQIKIIFTTTKIKKCMNLISNEGVLQGAALVIFWNVREILIQRYSENERSEDLCEKTLLRIKPYQNDPEPNQIDLYSKLPEEDLTQCFGMRV